MRPDRQEGLQRRFDLGFNTVEDKEMCRQAAEHAGARSLNAWLVMVVIKAARLELKCN